MTKIRLLVVYYVIAAIYKYSLLYLNKRKRCQLHRSERTSYA